LVRIGKGGAEPHFFSRALRSTIQALAFEGVSRRRRSDEGRRNQKRAPPQLGSSETATNGPSAFVINRSGRNTPRRERRRKSAPPRRFAPIAAVTSDASGGVRPFRRSPIFMKYEVNMLKLIAKAQVAQNTFKKDVSGAAHVEYSLLIGLITVAVVATIVLVGTWVSQQWVALDTAITAP
jgi:pilus assembly protein Flp/PilA